MATVITALITALVASLGTSGFLTWWFKKRIEHKYELKLAEHGANLKRDYDVQVEKLKAELAQQHLRFSLVFEHTEETIVTVYKNLLTLLDAVEDYTKLINIVDDSKRAIQLTTLQEASKRFYIFFHPNKIYLPRETATKINELVGKLVQLVRRHSMADMSAKSPMTNPAKQEYFNKEIEELESTIPKLLTALENDFQKILGFPIHNQK